MLSEHIQKMESQTEDHMLDFPKNLEWINSSPLQADLHLKGKVVVLFFWTSCCINCRHTLSYVEHLQQKYANDPVVFVGVHSPKYEHEKQTSSLKATVIKQGIQYPIVNDRQRQMMTDYGIKSWPTFVVAGPQSKLLFSLIGENQKELLDDYIASVLDYYTEFSETALPVMKKAVLSDCYPENIALDVKNNRLYISDTCHNRILVTDLEGNLLYRFSGFNQPRGLFFDEQCLYVADTGNHCVKAIHLATRFTALIAGTGEQGRDYKGGEIGPCQNLSSPWGIVRVEHRLYVTMAGNHQIWVIDLDTGVAKNFSGSGSEQNYNSVNLHLAAWAQPAGITLGENRLYIADSESSTIRSIDLRDNSTATLAGGSTDPYDLFSFGDRDGQGEEARLQHPLDIAWLPLFKKIVIADTFNHRLKWMDPITLTLSTLCGKGEPGHVDGSFEDAQFNEPSGIACHDYMIYVADTNNHCIRVIDLLKRTVGTITLQEIT